MTVSSGGDVTIGGTTASAAVTVLSTQTFATVLGATVRLIGARAGAVTITGPYAGFGGGGAFGTCSSCVRLAV